MAPALIKFCALTGTSTSWFLHAATVPIETVCACRNIGNENRKKKNIMFTVFILSGIRKYFFINLQYLIKNKAAGLFNLLPFIQLLSRQDHLVRLAEERSHAIDFDLVEIYTRAEVKFRRVDDDLMRSGNLIGVDK